MILYMVPDDGTNHFRRMIRKYWIPEIKCLETVRAWRIDKIEERIENGVKPTLAWKGASERVTFRFSGDRFVCYSHTYEHLVALSMEEAEEISAQLGALEVLAGEDYHALPF